VVYLYVCIHIFCKKKKEWNALRLFFCPQTLKMKM
jgi:hypothetical protein